MGQRYKGPRQTITTKVPVEQIPALDAIQRVTGEDRTALTARLISEYLASEEAQRILEEAEGSALPLSA